MALLPNPFDPSKVEITDGDFSPVPIGWYQAKIDGAELKPTAKGGLYIAVRYSITGPSHQGRVVFDNVNLVNDNPKAVDIGEERLSRMCYAIGLGGVKVRDTDELVGRSLDIRVEIQKSAEYGDKNIVKGVKATEPALGGASSMPNFGASAAPSADPAPVPADWQAPLPQQQAPTPSPDSEPETAPPASAPWMNQ